MTVRRPCSVCRRICVNGVCEIAAHRRGGYRPWRPSVVTGTYGRRWRSLRDAVLRAAGHRCAYCTGPARSGDHVVPVSQGGRTVAENVVAACHGCNTSKGDRSLTAWVHTGLAPTPAVKLLAARIVDRLPV